MYTPEFFQLYELVPREFYPKDGDLNERIKTWWLLDDRLLWTIDRLRKRYGKMICNDWFWRTPQDTALYSAWCRDLTIGNQYRGWRPPNCIVGSLMSQHKWGRASDLIPVEVTVDEIRKDIIMNHNLFGDLQHIRAVEMNVSWLHIDVRNWYTDKLHLIYP